MVLTYYYIYFMWMCVSYSIVLFWLPFGWNKFEDIIIKGNLKQSFQTLMHGLHRLPLTPLFQWKSATRDRVGFIHLGFKIKFRLFSRHSRDARVHIIIFFCWLTADSASRMNAASKVTASPPVFQHHLSNRCLVEGQATTFECQVIGQPPPEIQWTHRGLSLVGQPR